jgi:radical SAM superfamily enzyme YgiQ (UPF0313 family)
MHLTVPPNASCTFDHEAGRGEGGLILRQASLRCVVFISAMTVQHESVNEVIARCRAKKRRIAAGGPHSYHYHTEFEGVDHFVLGEAEDVMADLCADLEAGRGKHILPLGRLSGCEQDACARVEPDPAGRLRLNVAAILARLPVRL